MDLEKDKAFDRTMMEVAYMGALYGLGDLSREVFDFYIHAPSASGARDAARLGKAFSYICQKRDAQAAHLLEGMMEEEGEEDIHEETKALLVLAYKRQKLRGDRVAVLLEDLENLDKSHPAHAVTAHMGGL